MALMINDLSQFAKEINKQLPSLCLIVGKDLTEPLDIFLEKWCKPYKLFDGERFSPSSFLQEVRSLSLFEESSLCIVRDIDKLNDKKVITDYLKNPNPRVLLLLTSSVLLSAKEIESKNGIILQLKEEKPWQRKKRIGDWLKGEIEKNSVSITEDAIHYLIDATSADKELLKNELEKVIVYSSMTKKISLEDVKLLVSAQGHYTLWDLGEALFNRDFILAADRGKSLMDEGVSLFTIFAHLRTQMKTLIDMTVAYEKGGEAHLVQEFPYLKGNILSKKIHELQKNPLLELKQGLFLLFEGEVRARSHIPQQLALELFIAKYVVSAA